MKRMLTCVLLAAVLVCIPAVSSAKTYHKAGCACKKAHAAKVCAPKCQMPMPCNCCVCTATCARGVFVPPFWAVQPCW